MQSQPSNAIIEGLNMNFRNYSSPQNIITQLRIILNDMISENKINESLQSISFNK